MQIAIGLGIVAVVLLIGYMVYLGLRDNEEYDPLQERLMDLGERETPESLQEIELSMSFQDRVIIPVIRWFSNIASQLTPEKQVQETRRKLELAGMAGQIEPSVFFVIRVIAAIVLPLGAFMVFFVADTGFFGPGLSAGFTVGSALLGFFLPSLWIGSKISKRQDEIVRALPDALDLLTICVEAGLGFDSAMGKVFEKWDNDLALAFGRVLREIQLGKARREALRDMSERMDVPDVTSFIAAIIQADSLGVSMSQILRVQSDQMRVKRRQRAQEKAQAAPIKMMLPLVFLIFPSLWIVLLGPAAIKVLDSGALDAF